MPAPFPIVVKKASELRGLTFGNRIDDELLPRGFARNSLTFLYGENTGRMMNVLCANAARVFGGSAIYVDASNSADPYLIAKLSRKNRKSSIQDVEKILDSIVILRAFTCYQLYDIVARQMGKLVKEKKPHSIFVSEISSVFNEQDNSRAEIEKLQSLMASRLRDVADDKENGVQYVVASSKTYSERFVSESRTVLKFFEKKALLMKSNDERQNAQVEL
ncbi:MAG: P-loop NTPase family protein [Nitrososphaerales archaeon]